MLNEYKYSCHNILGMHLQQRYSTATEILYVCVIPQSERFQPKSYHCIQYHFNV